MILAKIYLDRDLLIFESAPNEDKNGIYNKKQGIIK